MSSRPSTVHTAQKLQRKPFSEWFFELLGSNKDEKHFHNHLSFDQLCLKTIDETFVWDICKQRKVCKDSFYSFSKQLSKQISIRKLCKTYRFAFKRHEKQKPFHSTKRQIKYIVTMTIDISAMPKSAINTRRGRRSAGIAVAIGPTSECPVPSTTRVIIEKKAVCAAASRTPASPTTAFNALRALQDANERLKKNNSCVRLH